MALSFDISVCTLGWNAYHCTQMQSKCVQWCATTESNIGHAHRRFSAVCPLLEIVVFALSASCWRILLTSNKQNDTPANLAFEDFSQDPGRTGIAKHERDTDR